MENYYSEFNKNFYYYLKSNDLQNFQESVGVWLIKYGKKKLKIEDDLIGEIYCKLVEKFDSLKSYVDRVEIHNMSAILMVCTRNILFTLKRKLYKDDIPKLNNFYQDDLFLSSPSTLLDFYDLLTLGLKPKDKIILCLRFNIRMGKRDKIFLNKLLKRNNIDPVSFQKELEKRQEIASKNHKKIISSINRCIYEIFTNEDRAKYNTTIRRKKYFLQKYYRRDSLFTLDEIGKIMNMTKYHIRKKTDVAIDSLKKRIGSNLEFDLKKKINQNYLDPN
jgi:hypothetical protein